MLRFSHCFTLGVVLAAALAGPAANAQGNANDRLTIKLDAQSTEANGVDGAISFRGVSITQGDTFIKADEAHSSGLDFLNSTWTFVGNVRFGARDTRVSAHRAVIDFREQVLVSAALQGAPVNFRQNTAANITLTSDSARLEFSDSKLNKAYFTGSPVQYEQSAADLLTNARADSVFFDAGAGVITLQDNAWIGEGTREITGNRISYNYEQRNVVATSNAEGDERVTITITPPTSDK